MELSAELAAMNSIEKAMHPLEPEAQERVLRWAADRFKVLVPVKGKTGTPSGDRGSGDAEKPQFDSLAEFYNAASPKTDAERALVVSYWQQVVNEAGEVEAQGVNSELKHLGHGVANITTAFDGLIERKPQLMIQTRKEGTTRQARKKYKVTVTGMSYVEKMVKERPLGDGE
jgi:hypothetical protein